MRRNMTKKDALISYLERLLIETHKRISLQELKKSNRISSIPPKKFVI